MKNFFWENNTKLAFILLLGIIIRLFGLFSRPIWYDEAFSLLFSNTTPQDMLYGTLTLGDTGSADIHPLGYYFLLWAWIQVFGNGIVAARLLSIFISIFSLILIYKIAKYLFNEKIGRTSLFFASTLAFQVHYAQEIRMYAFLELCLLITTYSFLKGRQGHWAWWIVFGLSSALAQFTHNLAVFYLIPLVTIPIIQKDFNTLKSAILGGLFALILYTPWLIHLPAQFSKVSTSYWVEQPGLEKIFTLILLYLPHLPIPDSLLFPSLLLSMLIMVFIIVETIKSKRDDRNYAIWTIYLAFMPPILLWIVSQIVPVYIERVLLSSHAIFCIWLGWAFSNQRAPQSLRVIILTLLLLSIGIGNYQHISYKGFPYGPYDLMAKELATKVKDDDIVIHSNKLSYLPTFYYNSNLKQVYIVDPRGSKVDTLALATKKILNLSTFNSIEDISSNTQRIWYIIYQDSINEYIAQGYESHPDIEYLKKNYNLETIEEWGNLRLYIYTRANKP